MKKILFSGLIIMAIFAGCSKPELATNNKVKRIYTSFTNAEMESAIQAFLDKIEDPAYYDDTIRADEAFEYIEASLNYLYGDIDYSYFGTILLVEGDQDVSFIQNGYFTIEQVKDIYDAVKDDWSTRFAEINDNDKKPAAIDIIGMSGTTLNYSMIFTYGIIDLSEYELPLDVAGNWQMAGDEMSNVMANHLNNEKIQNALCPNHRQYLTFVGIHDFSKKGPLNANDPNPGDGYIDNWFWYTNINEPGYNLNLDNTQFQFHLSKYFQAVEEYMQNYQPTKHVSMSWIMCDANNYDPNPPNWPGEAYHEPRVVYANLYCTQTSVSML